MSTTFAVIENDGSVSNLIIWDGNSQTWEPPEGRRVAQVPNGIFVTLGMKYVNGAFEPLPEVE